MKLTDNHYEKQCLTLFEIRTIVFNYICIDYVRSYFVNIKFEILKTPLLRYFPSLTNFQDKYLSFFFTAPDQVPNHYAYVCPLCIKNGIILCEDGTSYSTNEEFTLDHFPPEAVGGKSTVLVCKKCNNEAGAKYENSLKEKMQNMSFNKKVGSAKLKAKSQIKDVKGNYPTILSIRKDGTFEISFKPNEKSHAPLLDKWLDNSKTDHNWTAEVTIPVADENKVLKALLKTAYLFCFHYWGYEFAYSYTADQIRKILNDETEYPLKNPTFMLGDIAKSGQIPKLPLGLCQIIAPQELKCFLVNIHLIDKETGYDDIAGIIIPGPSNEDWDDLKRMYLILSKDPTINVTFNHVEGNSVADGVYYGYTKSWNALKA